MTAPPQPSDLELQILGVLWDRDGATVREMLSLLPDGKERAYTTILSVMQQMQRKGLLERSRDGSAHVYRAAVERRAVLRPIVGQLLRFAFGGDARAAMQCLFDETATTSDAELEAVRAMLEAHRDRKEDA